MKKRIMSFGITGKHPFEIINLLDAVYLDALKDGYTHMFTENEQCGKEKIINVYVEAEEISL